MLFLAKKSPKKSIKNLEQIDPQFNHYFAGRSDRFSIDVVLIFVPKTDQKIINKRADIKTIEFSKTSVSHWSVIKKWRFRGSKIDQQFNQKEYENVSACGLPSCFHFFFIFHRFWPLETARNRYKIGAEVSWDIDQLLDRCFHRFYVILDRFWPPKPVC